MRRFPIGSVINPIGEYVSLDSSDRLYLGEIRSVRQCGGTTVAVVRHFNGDPWPFEPALADLHWIRQD